MPFRGFFHHQSPVKIIKNRGYTCLKHFFLLLVKLLLNIVLRKFMYMHYSDCGIPNLIYFDILNKVAGYILKLYFKVRLYCKLFFLFSSDRSEYIRAKMIAALSNFLYFKNPCSATLLYPVI